MKTLIAIAALVVLSACATATPYHPEVYKTEADIYSHLGAPQSFGVDSEGIKTLTYSNVGVGSYQVVAFKVKDGKVIAYQTFGR